MPQTAACRPATAPAQPGVYRCSGPINGRPVWYEVGPDGTILDVRIVQRGDDEAAIAAQMWAAFRDHAKPKLELVKLSHGPSPSLRPFVMSPASLAGLFRRPAPRPVLLPRR